MVIGGLVVQLPPAGAIPPVDAALGPLPPPSPRSGTPDVRVRYGDVPPPPSRPADVATPRTEVWREGEAVYARCGDAVGVATASGLRLAGAGPGLHYVLAPLLGATLRHHRRHLVHAALIARDGLGILVLGPTGTGKSTVAALAARAGWEPLADDLVVVRPADHAGGAGQLLAHGVPRPANVPAEVLAAPGDLASSTPAPAHDPRARVAAPHLVPSGRHEVPVGAVVTLAWSTGRGDLLATPAHRRVAPLLDAHMVAHDPSARAEWFPWAVALARLHGAELRLAASHAHRGDDVRNALDELIRRRPPAVPSS